MSDPTHDNGELPRKAEGLPVAGYRAQAPEAIAKVNQLKRAEEIVLRLLDALAGDPETDKRWLATGRTDIEKGFMAANRSIFKPGRAELPDVEREDTGWLLELATSQPAGPLYVTASPGEVDLTRDHKAALRFARREDAEAFVVLCGDTLPAVRICEHAWS